MRTFKLVRNEDASGVSGTGNVAEGVEFDNGKCVMCWSTTTSSIAIYENVYELIYIHGHDGKTIVVFDDTQEVVTDVIDPEKVLEEYVELGLSLSTDGWGVALDVDKLLNEGVEWKDIPARMGNPDTPVSTYKSLHLVAKATGAI